MKNFPRSIALYLIPFGFFIFQNAKAAQNVFAEISPSQTASESQLSQSAAIRSQRLIDIDVQALWRGSQVRHFSKKFLPTEFDSVDGAQMQLPDGSYITLVPNRLQSHIKGINTYTGQVADVESGWFAISIEKDKAFGQVNVEYMVYEIKYDKSLKSHVLIEIDQSLRVRHTPDPLQKASSPDKPEPAGPVLFSHINNAAVRVLILHASDVSAPS